MGFGNGMKDTREDYDQFSLHFLTVLNVFIIDKWIKIEKGKTMR
jgi:hypothetical protein